MSVTIQLTGDIEVEVDANLDEIRQALDAAIKKSTTFVIHDATRGELVVNPAHVLYVAPVQRRAAQNSNGAAAEATPLARPRRGPVATSTPS